jgi:uncharacterized protein (TIGR02246 family)
MVQRTDDVEALYFSVLQRWNAQDAAGMAALFASGGQVVGFDGSELDGREAIEASMRGIFAHHKTPAYVAKVRSVRFTGDVAILRAVAGMIVPGTQDVNPALNTVQTLVAATDSGLWRVELFQNTPAAFHERPLARERLTDELRQVMHRSDGPAS